MENPLHRNLTGQNQEGNHPAILGDEVYNRSNEKLGRVKDVMIDLRTGKIEYLIIEFGEFLGIGEKFFVVPFRLLEMDSRKSAFFFDQKKEVLEKAPCFDKNHWPKTNSRETQESHTYWAGYGT